MAQNFVFSHKKSNNSSLNLSLLFTNFWRENSIHYLVKSESIQKLFFCRSVRKLLLSRHGTTRRPEIVALGITAHDDQLWPFIFYPFSWENGQFFFKDSLLISTKSNSNESKFSSFSFWANSKKVILSVLEGYLSFQL